MRFRIVIGALACGLAMCALATPAAAQGLKVDFSGGYQFHRIVADGDGFNMPAGWGASVALGNAWVKAVGDVAGNYKDGFDIHTFQGGVEFSGVQKRFVPYVRALTGLAQLSGGGDSESAYVFTPEAGVKMFGNDHVGAQVSVGYPVMFKDGEHLKNLRFFAGIVIRK